MTSIDDSVQIIDITDPYNPGDSIIYHYHNDGGYTWLNHAYHITMPSSYHLVTHLAVITL